MDSLLAAINEYRIVLGAIVLTLIAVLLVKKFWDQVSFFVLRIRMNAPFVGRISRLAKQPGRDKAGWFNSEKDVCSEFQPYFEEVDKSPQFYDICKNYLAKADELGRKELGTLGWLVISGMVFIEAMGFSYVLSGFTIPGASEALKQQGAIGIALLISGLLVFLTHWCGHELHHNSLIKKVRIWWSQSDTKDQMRPNQKVTLEKDSVDDADPEWRNLLSRIKANANVKPGYFVTVVTIIAVLCIGAGATYVRIQVLNAELIGEHDSAQHDGALSSAAAGSSVLYAAEATGYPPELVASQEAINGTSEEQIMDANLKGGMTTFMVLAVVFIFLQIVGVLLGFKTGFAGKESAVAHKFSHKFKNREEFTIYHERKRNVVAQIAQRNLTKLQAKMSEKLPQSTTDKAVMDTLGQSNSRTFLNYAQNERKKHGEYHVESSLERRDRDAQMESAQQAPAPLAAPETKPSPAPQAQSSNHGLSEDDIQTWMGKLGWDRQRTIDLLLKQRDKKQAEQQPEVSEEDALRMMEESSQ